MPLIPMPASREEWLDLRKGYVGASEVAALFGCQAAYALSHFALWHVKRGVTPPPVEGPRVTWGKRLEEVVALAVREEHGYDVAHGRYGIAEECRAGASLDFEIAADPVGEHVGPGVLETKSVDWLIHRRQWTDGEPPPHILLQLQHQLACTGFAWGAVACLVGGNDLRVYRYAARPTLGAEIKRRVNAFWQSITANEPPDVDGSDGASRILAQLYPELDDEGVDMSASNEWPEAVQGFMAAQAAKKAATEDYDEARNRLADLLGPHKHGWGAGYSVNTSVTPAKDPRPAREGEIISGRKESRKYTASIMEMAE
jgi:predicted phage-related endonuclease